MSSQKNVLEHRVLDDTKDSSHHHEEGASSSVSTLHSSKNRPPNDESRGVLMGDAFTVAHGTPSETVDRVYVTTTGPSPLGKAIGFQGQVYLVSEGNLACTRSKDGTHWRVHRQGNPKPQPILADDQRFNNHVHLESVAMCKAFLIHKDFEYYLNGHFSLYRDIPSKDTLEFTVALLQKNVEAILVDIPESVVLIRCDFPFYDSVDPESRVVIEHIILEYFRFPWLPNWKHKIRSALVQKPRPWFKSVTGEEDEVFPDDPLPNGYVAPSFDASTSPFVADQMPATTVSLPGLDDLLDTDTQPLSTAAGSAGNASQQDSAVALSFCDPPLPDKLSCKHFGQYAAECSFHSISLAKLINHFTLVVLLFYFLLQQVHVSLWIKSACALTLQTRRLSPRLVPTPRSPTLPQPSTVMVTQIPSP